MNKLSSALRHDVMTWVLTWATWSSTASGADLGAFALRRTVR